jgi:hypothetical protein
VDFEHALHSTLFDNFRRKIDLVVRRANTRTQLNNHVCGIRSETLNHLCNCVADDAEFGAFASGMHQTDGWRFWIDNVNRATVGDVNAHRDPGLICNESIAPGEMFVRIDRCIDNCNLVSVNLLGGEQPPTADANCVANFAMSCLKSPECLGFAMRNIDAWDSSREDVSTNSARIDRGELLDGKSFCRHEIERLEHDPSRYFDDVRERVVVVVVLVPLPVS